MGLEPSTTRQTRYRSASHIADEQVLLVTVGAVDRRDEDEPGPVRRDPALPFVALVGREPGWLRARLCIGRKGVERPSTVGGAMREDQPPVRRPRRPALVARKRRQLPRSATPGRHGPQVECTAGARRKRHHAAVRRPGRVAFALPPTGCLDEAPASSSIRADRPDGIEPADGQPAAVGGPRGFAHAVRFPTLARARGDERRADESGRGQQQNQLSGEPHGAVLSWPTGAMQARPRRCRPVRSLLLRPAR